MGKKHLTSWTRIEIELLITMPSMTIVLYTMFTIKVTTHLIGGNPVELEFPWFIPREGPTGAAPNKVNFVKLKANYTKICFVNFSSVVHSVCTKFVV